MNSEKRVLAVSVGICAHNEEKNIHNVLDSLLKQKNDKVEICEIIVVSDGSHDRTNDILKDFVHNNPRIRGIVLKERRGKYGAINEFLKAARSPVLVLASADVVLDENAVERLCVPFFSGDIGIIGGHPIPQNRVNSFLGYAVNLQWSLLHHLSCQAPKFGELVAFRNLIAALPPTVVDEEQIAFLMKDKGYRLAYAPDAIVTNRGPDNIRDFLLQRRRIYAGHLLLKKNQNYEVVTFRGVKILKCLLAHFKKSDFKNLHWVLGAIVLEGLARALGRRDVLQGKIDYKWPIAQSTKRLEPNKGALDRCRLPESV